MNEPVPSAVQEVVDIFTGELAHLRFGDLEGAVLARAAEEVKGVASEVAAAEAVLETVRARLAEKQDALLQKAQRALAYARVYAEGQPELAARIDQIAVPRAARRAVRTETSVFDESEINVSAPSDAARRRGRPRRGAADATLSLPTEGALDPVAVG